MVSFEDQCAKEMALQVSSVEIAGTTVFLGDCENRLVLVKIFETPTELPDTVVISRLSHYGRVMSFRRDKIVQFIESGVRMARMAVHQHIPSIINLVGEYVRVWYPNQPMTCRNCGSLDHLVKDCKSVHCFNCEKLGHRLEDCKEAPRCTALKSEDHRLADCPFVLYSANIDTTPKEQTEEEKLKDKELYKEKAEQARKKCEVAEKHQAEMQIKTTRAAAEGKDKGTKQDKNNGADKGDKNDKTSENKTSKDKGKDKSENKVDKCDDDKHQREKKETVEFR